MRKLLTGCAVALLAVSAWSAGELKHADVGSNLTKVEWEDGSTHTVDGATSGDMLYVEDSVNSDLVRLAAGSTSDVLIISAGLPAWFPINTATYWRRSGVVVSPSVATDSVRSEDMRTTTITADSGTFTTITDTGGTTGALPYVDNNSGRFGSLAVGATTQVLTIAAGVPAWTATPTVTSVATDGNEALAWDYVTHTITAAEVISTTCSIAWAGATTTNTVAVNVTYLETPTSTLHSTTEDDGLPMINWSYDGTAFAIRDWNSIWNENASVRLLITYLK